MTAMDELLRVSLRASYPKAKNVLKRVEFELRRGEILGLLGMRGGTGQGAIAFEGDDLLALPEGRMRQIRGRRIGLVPQSPLASLNPALKIGTQFKEAWRAHQPSSGDQWRREAVEALDLASLGGVA